MIKREILQLFLIGLQVVGWSVLLIRIFIKEIPYMNSEALLSGIFLSILLVISVLNNEKINENNSKGSKNEKV